MPVRHAQGRAKECWAAKSTAAQCQNLLRGVTASEGLGKSGSQKSGKALLNEAAAWYHKYRVVVILVSTDLLGTLFMRLDFGLCCVAKS